MPVFSVIELVRIREAAKSLAIAREHYFKDPQPKSSFVRVEEQNLFDVIEKSTILELPSNAIIPFVDPADTGPSEVDKHFEMYEGAEELKKMYQNNPYPANLSTIESMNNWRQALERLYLSASVLLKEKLTTEEVSRIFSANLTAPSIPTTEETSSVAKAAVATKKKRECYNRDHYWFDQRKEGMGLAAIRDNWNKKNPGDNVSREVVKKGVGKARAEREKAVSERKSS